MPCSPPARAICSRPCSRCCPRSTRRLEQSDLEGNIPGAQLRNLSPGYTLVLVNGKRRNNSAYTSVGTFPGQSYTDLSLIPVSAIDHVEVLRDGASAIYGSDAIAGVFNVILEVRRSTAAVSASSSAGRMKVTADRTRFSANKGFALGDYRFRESLRRGHRSGRRSPQPDLSRQLSDLSGRRQQRSAGATGHEQQPARRRHAQSSRSHARMRRRSPTRAPTVTTPVALAVNARLQPQRQI